MRHLLLRKNDRTQTGATHELNSLKIKSQLLQFTSGPGTGSETAPVPGAIVGQSAEGSTRTPETTDQPEGKTGAGDDVDPVTPPDVMFPNVAPVKSDFPT